MAIQLRVTYKEPYEPEWTEPYITCPYDRKKAESLVPVLKSMGCTDIKLIPAREREFKEKKLDKAA